MQRMYNRTFADWFDFANYYLSQNNPSLKVKAKNFVKRIIGTFIDSPRFSSHNNRLNKIHRELCQLFLLLSIDRNEIRKEYLDRAAQELNTSLHQNQNYEDWEHIRKVCMDAEPNWAHFKQTTNALFVESK